MPSSVTDILAELDGAVAEAEDLKSKAEEAAKVAGIAGQAYSEAAEHVRAVRDSLLSKLGGFLSEQRVR